MENKWVRLVVKVETYSWQHSRLVVTSRENTHNVAGLRMVASQHAMLDVVDRVVLAGNVVEERLLFAAIHER